MLNKLVRLFLLGTFTLFVAACSDSNTPQLGKQYSALPSDLSEFNLSPITEVFSLTCGHCRNMEASIPEIESLTKQKVGKVHVTFNQSAQVSAMLYYAAVMQVEGQPDHELVAALFEVVQQQEGTMDQKQERIEEVFVSRGLVSPYRFDSSHVAELEQHMTFADDVSKKADINSVPSFIIKGKYLLITEGHEDIKDLATTINYLLSKSE